MNIKKHNIMSRSEWKIIFVIFTIAFIFRSILFISASPFTDDYSSKLITGDSVHYHQLAITLVETNTYATEGKPHSLWAPGYPFFLSICYRLFGIQIEYAILVQIVISSLLFLPFFIFTHDIFSTKVRLIGSIILAFEPHLVLFSNIFLSETVFLALFISSLTCYIRYLKIKHISWLFYSALLLGLATLTRVAAQYFFILLIMHMFGYLIINRCGRQIIKAGIVFIIVFSAITTPWMMRNYLNYGYFSMSSGTGYNLLFNKISPIYFYESPLTLSEIRQYHFQQARKQAKLTSNANAFELNQAYLEYGLGRIKQDIYRYFVGHLIEIQQVAYEHREYFLFLEHLLQIETRKFFVKYIPQPGGEMIIIRDEVFKLPYLSAKIMMEFYQIIMLILILVYLLTNIKKRDPALGIVLLFVLVIFYFPIISSMSAPTRFRVPMIPFITFIGVHGLFFVLQYYRKYKQVITST